MENLVNLWKYSFINDPEYVEYIKIRELSGEVLDSFFNYVEPNFQEYSDTLREYMNELFYKKMINIDVNVCEIDGSHFFKLLLYNFINDNKKLSKVFYEITKIRKQEKKDLLLSITNGISSIFEIIENGSKEFKAIVRDINTNKTYEIIDTGIAYANKFINDNIKNSIIVTNLFEFKGIYFFDNSVILNKNQEEVNQLLNDNKKYKYDFIQFWMLAYSINFNK